MKNKCTARNGNGQTKIAANENVNARGRASVSSAEACQPMWIETRLFFGLGNEFVGLREEIPLDTPGVDWETFLHTDVVPTIGHKFTVLRGEGCWEYAENGETVRESSRVLLLVHPDTAEINEKLESLRRKWCERYHQESVLRVSSEVVARF